AASAAGYDPSSVLSFLDILSSRGLLEPAPDGPEDPLADRWLCQDRFWQTCIPAPAPATALGAARVLLVGLQPWGAAAALDLAAAGVGALHLVDGGAVRPADLALARSFGDADVGRPRAEALRETLARIAPRCEATVSLSIADGLADRTFDLVV